MTKDQSRVRVSGPLAPYVDGLAEALAGQGYPPERIVRHVQLLAHLSRWLDERGMCASDLNEERLAEYLEVRRAEGYAEVPRLSWVTTMLSSIPGLVVARASEPPSDSALDPILQEYRRYLVEQLSLAAPTVRSYLGTARAFLSQLDRSVMLDLSALTAAEVRTFVVSECRRLSVGSSKLRVTGLRSLLRFLFQGGYTTRSLVGAAPAPSAMSGGYLPRGVAPEAVAALLSSCDCSTATGRRDFAVLTVLSRLGLRVGEVASLVLEDLDWHHGELLVRGKGGRQDRLPLPADVGEAVVAYLVDGRPRVDERTVFMRVHAPITGMSGSNVSRIVASACRRAGVPVVHGHRLRHTAATAMLASGASLAEIGQVLRQSRAATTAVYAKVDRVALRRLARPWPEVVA